METFSSLLTLFAQKTFCLSIKFTETGQQVQKLLAGLLTERHSRISLGNEANKIV